MKRLGRCRWRFFFKFGSKRFYFVFNFQWIIRLMEGTFTVIRRDYCNPAVNFHQGFSFCFCVILSTSFSSLWHSGQTKSKIESRKSKLENRMKFDWLTDSKFSFDFRLSIFDSRLSIFDFRFSISDFQFRFPRGEILIWIENWWNIFQSYPDSSS